MLYYEKLNIHKVTVDFLFSSLKVKNGKRREIKKNVSLHRLLINSVEKSCREDVMHFPCLSSFCLNTLNILVSFLDKVEISREKFSVLLQYDPVWSTYLYVTCSYLWYFICTLIFDNILDILKILSKVSFLLLFDPWGAFLGTIANPYRDKMQVSFDK